MTPEQQAALIEELYSWIRAANSFAWVHEETCPRASSDEPCNCGLDSFLSRPRPSVLAYKTRIAELEKELEQSRRAFIELEPCGHAKNFLIGDEHGHFSCTVCRIKELQLAETRERQMWINAVRTVRENPADICHIGQSEDNPVRATLRPFSLLIDAARALVERLDAVHRDLAYQSVWVLYQNHGGKYAGPFYDMELNILREALAVLSKTPESNKSEANQHANPANPAPVA